VRCPSCGHVFDARRVFLEDDPDFQEFWAAYPRKQARKDALRAWHQLSSNRPGLPDLLAALATARMSQQWMAERGRYVPLAASWLRAERWTDAVPITRADGIVSAREAWRRIALMVEGPGATYLRSWVETRWDGPMLVVEGKTASAKQALISHWAELTRIAQDYDVTLLMDN